MHLIAEDIYLNVLFTSWGQQTGGFSWQRATPSSTGVRLTAQTIGNPLDLSWPVAGRRLQAQTNAPGVGITTNWVTVPGSTATNHVVVPIDPANGSAFYRLAIP